MKIDATTLLCATLGYPNRASRSPIMHNAGFEHLGIPYVYLAFEPAEKDMADVFKGMRALGIRFFSVTKPYKQTAMPFLDRIDPVAKAIGAVNGVLNEEGILTGYNSDWIGAADAIEEAAPLAGKRVLLIGTGGAGRAVAYGCRERGARVYVFNRTRERAVSLAREFGLEGAGGLDDLAGERDWDAIVNTTSVGMAGAGAETESPVPQGLLARSADGKPGTVLDAVIFPKETVLLKAAKAAGHAAIPGARMTLLQALFQFRLYTGGKEPPKEVMWKALQDAL
jgi:shikimate dehydrogenase